MNDRELREIAIAKANAHRFAKMRRDHEIELLLDANIPLAEAIEIVDRKLAS